MARGPYQIHVRPEAGTPQRWPRRNQQVEHRSGGARRYFPALARREKARFTGEFAVLLAVLATPTARTDIGQFSTIERRKPSMARGTGGKNQFFCHSYTGEFCHLPSPSVIGRHLPSPSATKRANDRPKTCHSLAEDKSLKLAKNMLHLPRLDRIRRVVAQTVATEFSHSRSSGRSTVLPGGRRHFQELDIADEIGHRAARTGARARGRPEGRASVAFGVFDFVRKLRLRSGGGCGRLFRVPLTRGRGGKRLRATAGQPKICRLCRPWT